MYMFNIVLVYIFFFSSFIYLFIYLFSYAFITVYLAVKADQPDSVSTQSWKGTGIPVAPAALLLYSCLLLPDQVVSDFDLFSGFTLSKVPVHPGIRTAAELNAHWRRGNYFSSSQHGLLMPVEVIQPATHPYKKAEGSEGASLRWSLQTCHWQQHPEDRVAGAMPWTFKF